MGSCSPFGAAVTVSSREFSPRRGIVVDRQDQNDALIPIENKKRTDLVSQENNAHKIEVEKQRGGDKMYSNTISTQDNTDDAQGAYL